MYSLAGEKMSGIRGKEQIVVGRYGKGNGRMQGRLVSEVSDLIVIIAGCVNRC